MTHQEMPGHESSFAQQRCPTWCRTFHRPGQPHIHQRVLFAVDGPPQVTATLLQGFDRDGTATEPMVHIAYDVGGTSRVLPVPPVYAEQLGEVLSALDFRDVGAFAAALGRSYRLTVL